MNATSIRFTVQTACFSISVQCAFHCRAIEPRYMVGLSNSALKRLLGKSKRSVLLNSIGFL